MLSVFRSGFPVRFSTLLAVPLLVIPFLVGLVGIVEDSAVIDELAHLPAGVSYVLTGDMRLNPEHPPLVKDLAGAAVILGARWTGTPLVFPDWLPEWRLGANDEWYFGAKFLYDANQVSQDMLRWGRLPMLGLTLAFGIAFFVWVRRQWGPLAGLIALALYALSPTVLAHGRYVTTDVAASAAFFLATVALLGWLERPTRGRWWLTAGAFGLAFLTKFSLLLLVPLGLLCLAVRSWLQPARQPRERFWYRAAAYAGMILTAFVTIVWPVYIAQTWNYPTTKQQSDLLEYEIGGLDQPVVRTLYRAAAIPGLRALAHYASGVLLVANRSQYGSTTYFLGAVQTGGHPLYFPIVALAKEPIPALVLTLGAGLVAVATVVRTTRRRRLPAWLSDHWREICFLIIIGGYWFLSITSALNIGVRHVLPTFPFAWALTAAAVAAGYRRLRARSPLGRRLALAGLALALGFQAWSVLRVAPHHLGYFNEAVGGVRGGSRLVADSNLDWGQDLNRLGQYVRDHGINRIAVDYFGGAQLAASVGPAAVNQDAEDGPVTGWFALSETYRTLEAGLENRYAWLEQYQPVARVGTSILVYYIPTGS